MNGQLLFQVFEILAEMLVGLTQIVDRSACMKHRCVVLSSAVQPNVRQG